jgi:hypothetical protein
VLIGMLLLINETVHVEGAMPEAMLMAQLTPLLEVSAEDGSGLLHDCGAGADTPKSFYKGTT